VTGWRRTAVWVGAALAGLVLAAGLTTAAATLSDQRVGLSSEPLTAGEQLAPPATDTASPTPTRTARPRATRTARPRRTATPTAARTSVPTAAPTAAPTTDDHGGHGGGDSSGSGRGRGRGGDD
jgi:hypothetical protein